MRESGALAVRRLLKGGAGPASRTWEVEVASALVRWARKGLSESGIETEPWQLADELTALIRVRLTPEVAADATVLLLACRPVRPCD